jgi:hypothetical protein
LTLIARPLTKERCSQSRLQRLRAAWIIRRDPLNQRLHLQVEVDTPVVGLPRLQVVLANRINDWTLSLGVARLEIHRLTRIRKVSNAEVAGIQQCDDLLVQIIVVLTPINDDRDNAIVPECCAIS